jgi:hypothetical protein
MVTSCSFDFLKDFEKAKSVSWLTQRKAKSCPIRSRGNNALLSGHPSQIHEETADDDSAQAAQLCR